MISKQAKENARKRLPFQRLTGLCDVPRWHQIPLVSTLLAKHCWFPVSCVQINFNGEASKPDLRLQTMDPHLNTFMWILNSKCLNLRMMIFIFGNDKAQHLKEREGWGLDSHSDCSYQHFVSSVTTRFVILRRISTSISVCHGNTIYRKTKQAQERFSRHQIFSTSPYSISKMENVNVNWDKRSVRFSCCLTLPSQWMCVWRNIFCKMLFIWT